MLAAISTIAACNPTTWRANFFSLASTAQRVAIIVTLSGGVKHCCGTSQAFLPNLFALFELVQEFIKLVMIRVFDDQLPPAFVTRFDFHMRSEACTHFLLQSLSIAAQAVGFPWL